MTGAAGWEQGLKPDGNRTLGKAAATDGSARARMHANAGRVDEDPGEPLVCPQCRVEYDTGLYCVDCDVELVGASFVDSAAPVKRRKERGWIVIAAILTAVFGLVVFTAIMNAWA